MENKDMADEINKIEVPPIWLRIVTFIFVLPILLVLCPLIMLVIAFAMEVGIVYMMFEFLITGGSKTDFQVTLGNKESKKENINEETN